MTKSLLISLCCLLLLVVSLPMGGLEPPQTADTASVAGEEITLIPVPFFASKVKMKKEAAKRFVDLLLIVLGEEHPAGDGNVHFLEVPSPMPAGLDALPDRRGSQAARLLAPMAATAGADGVMAFWLEGDVKTEIRMVALLYLPKRIEVERFTVSLNLEREQIALVAGKIEARTFGAALRAILLRNLDRIVPSAPADSDAAKEEAEDDGIDLVPGGAINPVSVDSGDLAADELSVVSHFGDGDPDRVARAPPKRVGVLPFSSNLRSDEKELRSWFGPAPFEADLQALAAKAVKKRADVKKLAGPVLTFEQLEAPAITIDPNYDPSAKLRRLARLCKDAGVDALLIGHLREETKGEEPVLTAYVRMFLTDPAALEMVSWRWRSRVTKSSIKNDIADALDDLYRQVGIRASVIHGTPRVASVGDSDHGDDVIRYIVREDEGLYSISGKCYDGEPTEVYPELADYNRIRNSDEIEAGQTLVIPKRLGAFERRPEGCRGGD